jgi:hypothetical protein
VTEETGKPVRTPAAGDEDSPAPEIDSGVGSVGGAHGPDDGDGAHEVEGADGGRHGVGRSRSARAIDELSQARRPVEMFIGGLFLTLAALPLILIGTALTLQVGAIGENLRRRLTEAGTGLDVGAVILLFRLGGGLLLIIGVLFVLFTWIALKPKRWARTGATVLAVVEIVLLVVAMAVTTFDPVSLGIVLLAGAGVVLMRLPHSEEFLLTSR